MVHGHHRGGNYREILMTTNKYQLGDYEAVHKKPVLGDYEAVHKNPVWRKKTDFIIAADISEEIDKRKWEQLWARQISEFRFEICCIPFFVYDLALGDEVETDENYVIKNVVKASGHSTYRVWFGESSDATICDEVVNQMQQLGCEQEWSSENLLAISAATNELAQSVINFLYERETLNRLIYETGRTKPT